MHGRRNAVLVAIFRREAVPAEKVEETYGDHIIQELDQYHRELSSDSDQDRVEMIARINSTGPAVKPYTCDQLRPLYRGLLRENLIKQEYRAIAEYAFELRADEGS